MEEIEKDDQLQYEEFTAKLVEDDQTTLKKKLKLTRLVRKAIKEKANRLATGELDYDLLNFDAKIDRFAFLQALEIEPNDLKKLTGPKTKKWVKYAIVTNPEYFMNLNKSQFNDELAQIFVNSRLVLPKGAENSFPDVVIKESYNNKTLLIIPFETKESEEISYYDKELELPSSLITNLCVTIRIDKALGFMQSMDIDLKYFGRNSVLSEVTSIIRCCFENAVLSVLKGNNYSYYQITSKHEEIKEAFIKNFNSVIKGSSAIATKINIVYLSFNRDITDQLEQQAFAYKKKREEISNELRYQKESLDIYQKKVEIHKANPGVEWNLTEAEKDKALERYFLKNGYPKEEVVALLKKTALDKRTANYNDSKHEKIRGTGLKLKMPVKSILFVLLFELALAVVGFLFLNSYHNIISMFLFAASAISLSLTFAFGWKKIEEYFVSRKLYKEASQITLE